MLKLGLFAAILMLGTSTLSAWPIQQDDQQRTADPRDLHHCQLRAIHSVDNDIHFDDDHRLRARPAKLPPLVARRILDHVSAQAKLQFTIKEWAENKETCAFIFSPVFIVTGPAGLQLYVAPRYFPLGNSVDYFFAYDPRTGAVTKSPPLIYTKWWGPDDPLIKRPIVRMEAGSKGKPPRLIVEERTHNGNVYNAVVYRYFEIGKDMSLTQVLAVEARAYILQGGLTKRKATFLSPSRVRINVTSQPPVKWASQGTVLLERSHAGRPFRVAQRIPRHGDNTLITYCDSAKSDDDFLRVGCDFYY